MYELGSKLIIEIEEGEFGSSLDLLRGILHCWLDMRDELLCTLSAQGEEWPTGDVLLDGRATMELLAKTMNHAFRVAERYCARTRDCHDVIWAMLDQLATKYGFTKQINWSITIQDEEAE